MSHVDMLVLGPVALRVNGRLIIPSAKGMRALLGVLAMAGRRGCTDAVLAGRLWGDPDNDAALRVLVHRTRAWLRDTIGPAVAVRRTTSGYLLDLGSGQCDLDRFRDLVATASSLPGVERAEALQSALALWRGPVLDNVPAPAIGDEERTALDRERFRVGVDCAAAWLGAGRADRAVALLDPLVEAHPLDEPAHSVWIEALAAVGRQADALAAYEGLRARLRDELGIDPSRPVSRVLTRVLRQEVPDGTVDAHSDGHYRGPAPAQLPAAVRAFVGRDAQLRQLDRLIIGSGPDQPETAICVIVGAAGVGKTTLAVQWAHRAARTFSDGQLHVDLRGYASAAPVRPLDALAKMLRALGVPADRVPVDVDEAAALYRSALAHRRVLVLLDNAFDAEQVRPLLPGSPGCLVLVTSRDRLDGLVALNGAIPLNLDVLEPADAVRLLSETVGARRVLAEPEAAVDIAVGCGCLPLALRIVAAHLIGRPALALSDYAMQLRERDPLASLALAGDEPVGIATTFAHSYRRLEGTERRMFRLLGLVPGVDSTAPSAAVLAGCPVGDARRALGTLAALHLLAEPVPGRYAFHDLLRAYAAELAAAEDTEDARAAALARLSYWYLASADAAARLLFPRVLRLPVPPGVAVGFEQQAGASEWLEQERSNLVATALHAARHGPPEVAWLLADALRMYLFRWRHAVDGMRIAEAAWDSAERAGDLTGQAAASLGLATAYGSFGDVPGAREHCERAVELSGRAGWADGEVGAMGNLAILHTELGDLDAATRTLEQARSTNRRLGNTAAEAATLNSLGTVHLCAGRLADAVDCHRTALRTYRTLGDASSEHVTLHNLGIALRELGRLDEAAELFQRKLSTVRSRGEHHGEAGALAELAQIHCDRSRFTEARAVADAALRSASRVGDRLQEAGARIRLAEACRHLGRTREATSHGERAIALAREIRSARLEAEALIGAALTESAAGRQGRALRYARAALARAHECGLQLWEARALTTLAELVLTSGRAELGIVLARHAMEIHTRAGSRLGEARACETLARCLHPSDPTAATPFQDRARDIYKELGIA